MQETAPADKTEQVTSHDVHGGEARDAHPRRRHPWLVSLGILLTAIAILLALWDWNWFRGPIEKIVESRTGRSFDIGGDLDVDLDWRTPTISAERLRFGDADWSRRETMASTDRVKFQLRIWPLFKGDVILPRLQLTRPQLHLEMGPSGTGNWVFGDEEPGDGPRIQSLLVEHGQLSYLDAATKTDIVVGLHSHARRAANQLSPSVAFAGGGRWKGTAFKTHGTGESPLELRDKMRPYRIDAHATAGATQAHARGTLVNPLRMEDFDLRLALSGKDMSDLYPVLGIVTPPTPPYRMDGRLTREFVGPKGRIWHYDDFKGVVGDSDVAGDVSVETGRERPYLRGSVVSRRLDFDDLSGFLGKAPDTGGKESTNPELAAQAAKENASTRLLPHEPYKLEKLRAMDADLKYKAHRIDAPNLPLDDMVAHLKLENGLLRLEPLDFGVAGGNVHSVIRMDARESPIRTRAQVSARSLNLRQMLPTVELAKDAVGRIGGDVALAGTGNSIAAMLGSSTGDVAVGMGRGQISNLLMELAGIDIAEALKFMVSGDRKIPVRCAFGDFSVNNGVMTTRSLAFDTTDTIIVGEGTVNLRDETLHLKLRPRPKDRSLLSLRAPLWIDGSFKDPEFHPDYGRIGLRGALALALGTIAPPAALLATLELGPGKDASCGGRYAK
ncbi:AsmA family protein [Agrilutibacter solisilvae]|uniref:AsmA family protein n=1 Tax=Agrilutibacter solisilvae TaxID=2763317 RepID=A0A974Y550_9GAMM|nr:AsmA family protein [Lysobacter solisilvae]QSX78436.1 AsmA family protein [Lysobacter solisilvae]